MFNIVLRALIFYILLMVFMRFMGKRQIGEMQMTEFITMVMLSELAVLPVTDADVPLLHGLVPLAVISSCEVMISYFSSKSMRFTKFISGNAVPLMRNGCYIEKNLQRTRISHDDVETQIRIGGYSGPEDVDTVILERTGKMSILPKEKAKSGATDN